MAILNHFIDTFRYKTSNYKPVQIIVLGFLSIIFIGTAILLLPFSTNANTTMSTIDALFMSTSALCVTGLYTVNIIENFTMFGKIVFLILIQIGGLGFIAILSMTIICTGNRLTLKDRLLIQESFSHTSISGMSKLVIFAFKITFVLEVIGALILSFYFSTYYNVDKAIGYGIFHAVSAFCNAGFDIISNNSLVAFANDYIINIVFIVLMISGGLGFVVWYDLVDLYKTSFHTKLSFTIAISRLNLHTKIAIIMAVFLTAFGTLFFFLVEYSNAFENLSFTESIFAALFQSVTTRTSGFYTTPQSHFTDASKIISNILSFIGGGSASTSGGIKTVTFAVVVIAAASVITGKDSIEIFKKKIPFWILQKSITVILLYLTVILVATILLCFTENYTNLSDIINQVYSAVTTVGISNTITKELTSIGKIIISICMFIGRLGPIVIIFSLADKKNKSNNSLNYPEENVLVG